MEERPPGGAGACLKLSIIYDVRRIPYRADKSKIKKSRN
jgi:hypothetical protein